MNLTESIVRTTRMVGLLGVAAMTAPSYTGAGDWQNIASAPQALNGARACEVDGIIYLTGGSAGCDTAPPHMLAYDTRTDQWQTRAPIPTSRYLHAACVVDGMIYVIGGAALPRVGPTPVEVYDPRTDTWTRRAPLPPIRNPWFGGQMSALPYAAATAVDGIIYLTGGGGEPFWPGPLDEVYAYDPRTDSWTVRAPLPAAVGYPSSCAVNGTVYVFDRGEVFAYDPASDRWDTRTFDGVEPTSMFGNPEAIGAYGGLIYMIGPSEVVIYDPVRSSSRVVATSPGPARYDAASIVAGGQVYVFGGSAAWAGPCWGHPMIESNQVYTINSIPPVIARQPLSQTVSASGELALSVDVEGGGASCTYQWQYNGVDISGATSATLTLPCAQRCHAGAYSAVVTNNFGSTTSEVAVITVDPPATNGARLLNLSNRALCLTGESTLIPGFVISGSDTKQVLLRAVGPKLAELGVSGALADPTLRLRRLVGDTWTDVATNDDWASQLDGGNSDLVAGVAQRVGAFALDLDGKDAALLVDLPPGVYSVAGVGKDGCTGVELVEIYDADQTHGTTRLTNISNRGFVGTGANVMIPGFVVSEEGPKTFLVRAVGPGLQAFGVCGVLADPRLAIYRRVDGDPPVDQLILGDDNWSDVDAIFTADIADQVGAFALAAGSLDAAVVVTLPPGTYTAVACGADGGSGVALVELYEVQ